MGNDLCKLSSAEKETRSMLDASEHAQSILDQSTDGGAVTLNDFKVVKKLGQGGFGKVFLVQRKGSRQKFAMKVVKKSDVLAKNLIRQIMTERHILAQVASPFVVDMHFAFQTDEKLYFIMDYVKGGELHAQIQLGLSEDEIRFYGSEIVLGLEYLHSLGIVYRDLKSENVLISADGHVKLTDFGLSKQLSPTGGDVTHTMCGTPDYVAPEVLSKQGHTESIDWWALGILLYEMYVKRTPFVSMNLHETLKFLHGSKPVCLDQLENASDQFRSLVGKLL